MASPDSSWRLPFSTEAEAKKKEAESQRSIMSTDAHRAEMSAGLEKSYREVVAEDRRIMLVGVGLFVCGVVLVSLDISNAYAMLGSIVMIAVGLMLLVLGFAYKYLGE